MIHWDHGVSRARRALSSQGIMFRVIVITSDMLIIFAVTRRS
jgi:hypothetical protein